MSAWDGAAFNRRLAAAVERGDRDQVGSLVDELVDHVHATEDPYPVADASVVLTILRRKRYFDQIRKVADTFVASGQKDALVRRHYGQALIEESELTPAIEILEGVVAETEPDTDQNKEARGLIGRAYKQRYIDATASGGVGSPQDIASSIEAYWSVYRENPADPERFWHGINAVAVIERASADGVAIPDDGPDPGAIAEEIRSAVELRRLEQSATMWDLAAALEACVALGREEEAVRWAEAYTQHPNADAFEFASTLRQFEQVWQLIPTAAPGETLLPLLQAALLRQEEAVLEVRGNTDLPTLSRLTSDGTFEAVLGEEMFKNVQWLESALTLGESVARVRDQDDQPQGTGFVVRHGDLDEEAADPDELLLLTNAHVVSEREDDTPALFPDEAKISFERDPEEGIYTIADIVWSSPIHELDATLIRTDPPLVARRAVSVAGRLPRLNDRVYIIGHPGHQPLSYSIYDNRLLNVATPHLHYRTPTEGGSSGSPVFNRRWQLIGVHHKGGLRVPVPDQDELQPANEGIVIHSIQGAIPRDA